MAKVKKIIKKNGEAVYRAVVYLGRDPYNPQKQIRKTITYSTEKECRINANEMEKEAINNTSHIHANAYFDAWAEKWLLDHKNEVEAATQLTYALYVKSHFIPFFGRIKLDRITDIRIQEYKNSKLSYLSPTTVRKHMILLSRILRAGLGEKNPARNVKYPSEEKYIPHIVVDQELITLLEITASNPKSRMYVLIAAFGGLRRGEIFALKLEDINFNDLTITVDESLSITEDGYQLKGPKSENGKRKVYMPLEVMEELKEYCENKKIIQMDDRLFEGTPAAFGRNLNALIKRHGMNFRLHDLRHYQASLLYRAGVPDQYAAARLGHDVQILKKIYQHLDNTQEVRFDKKIKSMKLHKILNTTKKAIGN